MPDIMEIYSGTDCHNVSDSFNLVGQKLGKKGNMTRKRILEAASEQIYSNEIFDISLSSVARSSGVGASSVYNYFSDFSEIVLSLLEPAMDDANNTYIEDINRFWNDDDLADCIYKFVEGYHGFWVKNAPLLHLRNNMADARDKAMMLHRVEASQPVIRGLIRQMKGVPDGRDSPVVAMATFLMTGLERTVTVNTDIWLKKMSSNDENFPPERYLRPCAHAIEIVIRDFRARC